MSEDKITNDGPSSGSTRLYIIFAAVLIVVIVIVAVLLITVGLPALKATPTPVAVQPTITPVPTFTPGPTRAPTNTPPPTPTATPPAPYMGDTDTPLYRFEGAGGRPSTEWTGFFGYVTDAAGNPLEGVPLIVWYADEKGTPASPVVYTDANGYYEIHLADTSETSPPKGFAGVWSIQVLTPDNKPASKLFTFRTDEDTKTGIQQIQVLWKRIP